MKRYIADKSLILRLSERDRLLLIEGLRWVVNNYNWWRTKHQLPNRRIDRIWASNVDSGTYQQLHMDRVLSLHAGILSLGPSGRLRIQTATDVAAYMLAVRIAVKRHNHGHRRLNISRIDTSSKRLLLRLEAARKRAKRAEIRQMGLLEYRQSADGWRSFVRWLHYHFLDCSCSLKRRTPPIRRHRVSIAQLSKWARAELMDRKKRIPTEAELRKMVRLAVRYIRRGRTGFVIRDLLNNRRFAAEHLANFVTARMEKTRRSNSKPEDSRDRKHKKVNLPSLNLASYDPNLD